MIAEACHFYGWLPDYALAMPASRFWVLYEKSKSIRNKGLVLSAWASRAGTVTAEGFHEIVGFFENLDLPKVRPPDVVVEKRPPLSGNLARRAVMGAFKSDRRIKRSAKR